MKKKFKLITLLLAFVLLFTPISVHAGSEGNGGGENDNTDLNEQDSGNYPSYSKTGFLVYLVDSSGSLCSKVVFVSASSRIYNTSYYQGLLTSRIGGAYPSEVYLNAEWGYPFTESGQGRGTIIKDELANSKSYDGTDSNAYYVTKKYLGDEALQLFRDDPKNHYLILETVAWHAVFSGAGRGLNVVASASGWAQFEALTGMAEKGDGHTGWCDNNRLQNGCHLIAQWQGLPPVPTKYGLVSYSEIMSAGYGMIAVRGLDAQQTTCDEGSLPAPHPAAVEAEGNKVIIKNYRTKNITTGEVTDDGCFITEKVASSIVIEDESEYKVVEWKVSSTKSSLDSVVWPVPSSVSQSGKDLGLVELKNPTEKVLYVLLERTEEEDEEILEGIDFIIEQSQVSRQVFISEAKTNESAKNIKSYQFIWDIPKLKDECSGHDYEDGTEEYDSDHDGIDDSTRPKYSTAYCEDWEIIDSEIQVGLKNSLRLDYPEILSDSWYKNPAIGDEELQEYDRGQDFSEQEFITDQWDEKIVIHRGKDKLTIAEWKGTGLDLANITDEEDMYPIANTPQGRRKSADFTDTFDIELKNNSPDVTTISKWKTAPGHGVTPCEEDSQDATIESYLISPINVYIKTYSGSADGGTNNTDCATGKLTFSSGNRHISGVMVPTGTTISFFPYIWMRFDTLDDKDIQVDVLGQYRRSISPNDYAEVIWNEGSYPNMTIYSNQWSTHAMSTSGQDWRQADSVLPGGAIMNLGIKQSDRQVVTVRTYQTILIGPGLEQVEATGSGYEGLTEEAALANHEATVAQVADSLDNLSVEQYVNTNWSSSPFSGQIVSSGGSLGSGFDAKDRRVRPRTSIISESQERR